MNKKSCITGAIAILFASSTVFSQQKSEKELLLDEVVISATKFNLKKEKVGKVIFKITQEQIKNNAGKTVMEVLNNIPGIEIKGTNSALGEIKGTYVRGGRNRQVLVLIDGVPMIDPTGISSEYDLRLLSLDQIESIEVLKGASSTLYGSGAATGVINITLKKASADKISGMYELSLGTNNSTDTNSSRINDQNLNASINGSTNKFNYLASIGLVKADGFSAAKSQTEQEFSSDPFYSERGMLKLGYKHNNSFKVESFFNLDNLEYSYDAGAFSDSEVNKVTQKQVRFGVRPTYNYAKGNLFAIASVNTIKRFSGADTYEGNSTNLEVVNQWNINEDLQLISGVNYQDHSNQTNSPWGNIDEDVANFNTLDVYITSVYSTSFGLNFSAGGRLNNHSNYGSHFVYHLNPSYNVYNTDQASLKLLTSYSTAFIAPGLYQLFSVYGNTELTPETNETFEIGFESSYKKWFTINVVYFDRIEENAVIFNSLSAAPWGVYNNATSTIKTNGIESFVNVKATSSIDVNVGFTYTNKDAEANYIPKNKLTAQVTYKPFERTFVSIDYKNVSERTGSYYDTTIFSTVTSNLPSYQLFDINANYELKKNKVTIFGTVSNIFNEDYEETIGYNTRGRNIRLGLRLNL